VAEDPDASSLWDRKDALSPRAFVDLLELIADASEAVAERRGRRDSITTGQMGRTRPAEREIEVQR
jgi:hypothetical protein